MRLLAPLLQLTEQLVEGGVGLFGAGVAVEVDGFAVLVGCGVVVGDAHVDAGIVDADGLHTDGAAKGVESYAALGEQQQTVPVAGLVVADAAAHGGVLVVPLAEGVVQRGAELVFEEVMLTIVYEAYESVDAVEGVGGAGEAKL